MASGGRGTLRADGKSDFPLGGVISSSDPALCLAHSAASEGEMAPPGGDISNSRSVVLLQGQRARKVNEPNATNRQQVIMQFLQL